MKRARGGEGLPFVAREIERFGRERPVAAGILGLGALPVLVIIGDRLEPPLGGAGIAGVADDQIVVAKMVEQGRQPLLEQGQPMVDAGDAAPVRHRLVERVAGRIGAEQFAIGRAEALDAVLVEQGLGRRQQGEAVDPVDAALGGGIEAAHALDLVAEEIEAQRLFFARGKQVDDAAAHGELAGIAHRLGAAIAVRLEEGGQPGEIDPLAGREPGDQLADAERRQRPLRRRVDRGDEELRLVRLALERVQRGQPLGGRAQRRRAAVVGQAIPGREGQHLQLGREIACRVRQCPHRRLVRRHEHGATLRRARQIGGEPGHEPARHAGQRHRLGRRQDFREVAHLRLWVLDVIELLEAAHHFALPALRRGGGSQRPGQDIDVLLVEERFEPVHLGRAPAFMPAVEIAADQHVGLSGAAVPGAEAKAFDAGVRFHTFHAQLAGGLFKASRRRYEVPR